MGLSGENSSTAAFIKPTNKQGGSGAVTMKAKPEKRRALSVINPNLIGSQPYTRALKRSTAQPKQGISEKNNQDLGLHRPVTRSFVVQVTNIPEVLQQDQEDLTSQKPHLGASNCSAPLICIDDEEDSHEDETDLPVPMFMEETGSNISQVNHIEEVEMKDVVVDDLIMDIDGCDAKNPLAVVEYVDDIFSYYRKMEASSLVSPDYMARQGDINERMRAILIDWLVEVHDKFELTGETLFLTVNLIDRFLAEQTMPRKKLQLVGLVALLLACKYEEVSAPVVSDLIFISDKAYTRSEVLEMESMMLNTLQFNMSLPTPYVFMQRFLKAAQSEKRLQVLSFFLIELCLVEYEMLKFPPSLLAASTIYTAQCTLYGFKEWTKTCEWHTNYSQAQLMQCSKLIVNLHQKAGTGKLTGVHKKYSASKYGYATKCEAAQFLLSADL